MINNELMFDDWEDEEEFDNVDGLSADEGDMDEDDEFEGDEEE